MTTPLVCLCLLFDRDGVGTESEINTTSEEKASVKSTQTEESTNLFVSGTDNERILIRLTFTEAETVTMLEDNPTTQILLEQLPITIIFEDFADVNHLHV